MFKFRFRRRPIIFLRSFSLSFTRFTSEEVIENWDRGARSKGNGISALFVSIKRLIDKNPECVSLIQVGSFYELYFAQAEEYGPKLGLKLTSKKSSHYTIPFTGFPVPQLKKFTEMLIKDHKVNVAIIDQCSYRTRTSDALMARNVTRIVTPGTLIDESFLNFSENNYLLAISFPPNITKDPADPQTTVGLSWVDISVGESFVQQTTLGQLSSDIARINPSEILIPKDFEKENLHLGDWFSPLQVLKSYIIKYHTTTNYGELKSQFEAKTSQIRKHFETISPREQAAMNMVLSYVSVNLPDAGVLLDLPSQYVNENCLQMDPRTREALELTERTVVGRTSSIGSFLSVIKKTATSSGTRLLREWINSPSLDRTEIMQRQSYVNLFLCNKYLTIKVRQSLSEIGDFIRILQSLKLGRGDVPTQLLTTAKALDKLQNLKDYLQSEYDKNPQELNVLQGVLDKFVVPHELAKEIHSTFLCEEENTISTERLLENQDTVLENELEILDDTFEARYLTKQDDGQSAAARFFSIRKDYNEELAKLHEELGELEAEEEEILQKLQTILNKIDPKLNFSKKTQYSKMSNVIQISGKAASIDKLDTELGSDVIQKKKSSLLYRSRKWQTIQHVLADKMDSILEVEKSIINELRRKVISEFPRFRELSRLVDYLDVTASFAIMAQENHWVCPKIIKTPNLSIVGGRHVVVESSLRESGDMFTPNDSKLGVDGNLWIISGPNMGGKSTYLRQNALIVILAQIGSYVPAEKASIGIVDRIFTRIGATDDLYNDLSTFMVEMVETSNILKNATPRSLAIVDEVGRGTSGKEGLAIAYATLYSLLTNNKCRTLFATHFGKELKDLLTAYDVKQDKIRFYRTRVLHEGGQHGDFIIDHSLEPGISDRSHAVEVARMAGFPKSTLDIAEKVLNSLHVNSVST